MDVAPKKFLDTTQIDPLFAAEGMDLERAEIALDSIVSTVATFEEISADSFFRRIFFKRYPIGEYVLPIPFIRAFLESERQRRRFLSDSSMEQAEQLVRTWECALTAYRKSVQRSRTFHRIILALNPMENDTYVLDMVRNKTFTRDVFHVFDQMAMNIQALEKEVLYRRELLEGKDPSNVPARPAQLELLYKEAKVSSEHMHIHELEVAYAYPFYLNTIEKRTGPFSLSLPHFDGVPTEHPFMLYVLKDKKSGIYSMKVSILDYHAFLKLIGPDAKFSQLGRAGYLPLIERGIPYWFQSITTFYSIRDMSYWADIATLADLQMRPELNEELVRTQRSSMFDLMLGVCADDHKIYLDHTKERIRQGGKLPRPWYFLLMRAHAGIYFLPFNGSVWRLPEKANYLGSERAPSAEDVYVPLENVLADTDDETFKLVMQSARIRREAREKEEVGISKEGSQNK